MLLVKLIILSIILGLAILSGIVIQYLSEILTYKLTKKKEPNASDDMKRKYIDATKVIKYDRYRDIINTLVVLTLLVVFSVTIGLIYYKISIMM